MAVTEHIEQIIHAALLQSCDNHKDRAARGRAEGALATSGTAGVVEGWRARAEAAEARVAVLQEALHRIANQAWDHDERGITYSVGYAFSRVQGIARSALSRPKEEGNDA